MKDKEVKFEDIKDPHTLSGFSQRLGLTVITNGPVCMCE
jgi:hypothetical protein